MGTINVGATNALAKRAPQRARADVLLTVDVALHELTHVIQFAKMPAAATPNGAIVEGMADAVAIFATGDDTLGEGMYKTGPDGRPMGSVRELGGAHRTSGAPLGVVINTYAQATAPGAEEHAAGGVVSATFIALRASVGRETAERLLWNVIRDAGAWSAGGTWSELARAMRRAAGTDAALLTAVDAALASTGLNAALR